ncbi:hypothetical protein [Yersinia phage vB_YenS-P840]|nr:hypothetical protein [Yersinia phage vB_YenS-P840]
MEKHIEELRKAALNGVSDEMLLGGWTAKGISDYAKSLEEKNVDLIAQLEAAEKIIKHKNQLIELAKDEHQSTIERAEEAEKKLLMVVAQDDRQGFETWVCKEYPWGPDALDKSMFCDASGRYFAADEFDCLYWAWMGWQAAISGGYRSGARASLAMKVIQWQTKGRVGVSSATMAAIALGLDKSFYSSHFSPPSDPADLSRCMFLVDEVPEIRDYFPTIAEKVPRFAGIIANWDEITTLLITECKRQDNRAPETFALMKKILGE